MDRESHRQIDQCKAVLKDRIDFAITAENLVILPQNAIVIQTESNRNKFHSNNGNVQGSPPVQFRSTPAPHSMPKPVTKLNGDAPEYKPRDQYLN